MASKQPAKADVAFERRRAVFDAWKTAFKKRRGVFKSGDKRDRAIRARLKEWTIEDVVRAINGYAMDPWRHEQPSRHELATLLRNDGQIEAGLEIHDDGGKNARAARNAARDTRKRKGGNATVDYTRERSGEGDRDDRSRRDPVQGRPASVLGRDLRRDDAMDFEELF